MINHVRTILLNQSSSTRPGYSYPGEEYVPDGYKERAVSIPVRTVRQVLFAAAPDRAMLNYRLRQYLSLIHSSELEEFVLAKDRRITYWPFDDSILRQVVRGPVATQIAVPNGSQPFYFLHPISAVEVTGRLKQQWQLEVTDGSTVTINTYNDDGLSFTTTQGYTVTDGLSSTIVLPGSGLRCYFQEGIGASWQIDVLGRPALSLPNVVNNAAALVTGTVRDGLFGETPIEPYKTFRDLWDRHDVTTYRLGALVLALAYRMDEDF